MHDPTHDFTTPDSVEPSYMRPRLLAAAVLLAAACSDRDPVAPAPRPAVAATPDAALAPDAARA
ncbi:hypothetical protein PYV61_25575, partial [Roseisolibacter sp. H3M3-2]|nr:hypothetical protein [Roseisolibacter sp. H3M3-2]